MADWFDIAFTPAITELQERKGSRAMYDRAPGERSASLHLLADDELQMITTRDSFYMATVGETGWPYVQHRGGDAGFVVPLGPSSLGWVERSGNRQYVGTGNVAATGRVALIFMDYPSRTRLKLYGTATHHPEPTDELVAALGGQDVRVDGAITIDVIATMWNCPKYITPRFTEEQVHGVIGQLQERIAELEVELESLRPSR